MKTLELTLWGQKVWVKLNSDQSEEFIRCVADYLNNKKTEVEAGDPNLISTQVAAARAAFLIAADYFTEKQRLEEVERRVELIEALLKNC
jgi:cell division protein ZapA (FtsZ GTPase activity inhibitor)